MGLGGNQEILARWAQMYPEDAKKAQESGQSLGDYLKEKAKGLEKTMMREALQGAAVNAGIQIGVSLIPGVGQAIAAVLGAVNLIGGRRYKAKLEEHVKKRKEELENYSAKKQKELDQALTDAYRSAYDSAIKLAISYQPLKIGGHTFEKDILNPHLKVSYTDGLNGLGAPWDKLTGKEEYDSARKRIDQMTTEAKKKIAGSVDPIIRRVRTSGFRALVGKQIAIEVRKRPELSRISQLFGTPSPSNFAVEAVDPTSPAYTPAVAQTIEQAEGVSPPSSNTPLLLGAAALGAVLLLR
jgi:hypothetical protein